MSSRAGTDLNRYLGNIVIIETTLNQHWTGLLRGFDEFMNCTVENLQQLDKEKKPTGEIFSKGVVRGKSIISIESSTPITVR